MLNSAYYRNMIEAKHTSFTLTNNLLNLFFYEDKIEQHAADQQIYRLRAEAKRFVTNAQIDRFLIKNIPSIAEYSEISS